MKGCDIAPKRNKVKMETGSEDEVKGTVEGTKEGSGLRLFLVGIMMSETETMKLSP